MDKFLSRARKWLKTFLRLEEQTISRISQHSGISNQAAVVSQDTPDAILDPLQLETSSVSIGLSPSDLLPYVTQETTRRRAKKIKKEVLHENAFYMLDGREVVINYKQLILVDKYLEAKNNDLFSCETGQKLQVRLGKNGLGRRHFYAPSDDLEKVSANGPIEGAIEDREKTTSHKRRISNFLNDGNNYRPTRIITYDSDSLVSSYKDGDGKSSKDVTTLPDIELFTLADIRNHSWKECTEYQLVCGLKICPDIIGVPPVISKQSPLIFVEVIDKSYPSDAKQKAYCEASRNEELVVIFDFVKPQRHEKYYLQVRKKNPEVGRTESYIRTIFHISSGLLRKNTLDPNKDGTANYNSRLFENRINRDIELSINGYVKKGSRGGRARSRSDPTYMQPPDNRNYAKPPAQAHRRYVLAAEPGHT